MLKSQHKILCLNLRPRSKTRGSRPSTYFHELYHHGKSWHHCSIPADGRLDCIFSNDTSGLQFDVVERDIPLSESVRGACEVLGLNALQVACEGRFVVILPKKYEAEALDILKTHDETATVIGQVADGERGLVMIETPIGGRRILDVPAGEHLPWIC